MLLLQQNQLWKNGDELIRIVNLERLAVDYKIIKDLETKEGTHHRLSKKEFCRLIRKATLMNPVAGAGDQDASED
jgi:hypothetical protein